MWREMEELLPQEVVGGQMFSWDPDGSMVLYDYHHGFLKIEHTLLREAEVCAAFGERACVCNTLDDELHVFVEESMYVFPGQARIYHEVAA